MKQHSFSGESARISYSLHMGYKAKDREMGLERRVGIQLGRALYTWLSGDVMVRPEF